MKSLKLRFAALLWIAALAQPASGDALPRVDDGPVCDAGGPYASNCSITQGGNTCSVGGCAGGATSYACCTYEVDGTPSCRCVVET